MAVDCGRKPLYLERTHTGTGRTCKFDRKRSQTAGGFEPGTVFLWANSAHHILNSSLLSQEEIHLHHYTIQWSQVANQEREGWKNDAHILVYWELFISFSFFYYILIWGIPAPTCCFLIKDCNFVLVWVIVYIAERIKRGGRKQERNMSYIRPKGRQFSLLKCVNGSSVISGKPQNDHLKICSSSSSHFSVGVTLFLFLQPVTHSLLAFLALLSRANRSSSTSVPSPLVKFTSPKFSVIQKVTKVTQDNDAVRKSLSKHQPLL